jgi:hypothetical protein
MIGKTQMNDNYNHIHFLGLLDTLQALSSINYKKVKDWWAFNES